MTPDPESRSTQTLRPWRRVIAVLVVLQLLGLVGLLVVLFIGSVSDKATAYAITGAILLTEVGQWGLAKAALRKVPDFDRATSTTRWCPLRVRTSGWSSSTSRFR